MSNCRVFRHPETDEIIDIIADNGNSSTLFQRLRTGENTRNNPENIYGNTRSDTFKALAAEKQFALDENNEPLAVKTLVNGNLNFISYTDLALYNVYDGAFITQKLTKTLNFPKLGNLQAVVALNDPLAERTTYKSWLESRPQMSEELGAISDRMVEILGDWDVPIITSRHITNTIAFYDPNTKAIYLNPKYPKSSVTMVHEITHALTYNAIHRDQGFASKLSILMGTAEKVINTTGRWDYAFSNPHEFVAHAFSHPEFQQELDKVPYLKSTNLWDRFIQIVRELFGIDTVLTETLRLVVTTIENTSFSYANAVPIVADVLHAKEYISDKIVATKYAKNPLTEKYEGEGKSFSSVTGDVIPAMESKQYLLDITKDNSEVVTTPGERRAEILWKDIDPSTKQQTKEADYPIDKPTFISLYDAKSRLFIAKGNILHKTIHEHFTKDSSTRAEIEAIMADNDISKGEVAWMNNKQNILNILHRAGTDYVEITYENGDLQYVVNPTATDRIKTEVPIVSPLLGIGGTVDMIIDHGNGILSYKDIKTGAGLDRLWEHDMYLYGTTPNDDMFVNPRNAGKLQLMWYMVMTKVENPTVRFRDSELIHLPNFNYINNADSKARVNAKDYLYMIEGFLKDKRAEVYKQLQELPHFEQIFDPATYNAADATSTHFDVADNDVAKQIRMKMLRLQSLVLWDKNVEARAKEGRKKDRLVYEEIQQLMKDLITLRGSKEIDYSSWNTDMSWMDTWLGSASASTNPYIQLYYTVLQEGKDEASKAMRTWTAKMDYHTKRLMREAGMTEWKTGLGSLVGGVDTYELFKFMLKSYDFGGVTRMRYVTSSDPEWNSLTDTQKAAATFILDSVDQFFEDEKSNWIDPRTGKKVALANRMATERKINGKVRGITNLELAKGSNRVISSLFADNEGKYYRGWMPKYMPQESDILRDNPWYSGKFIKFLANKYTTNYYEAFYDGWYQTEEVIPLKFLGSASIDNNQNHTLNVPLMMTNFVQQYYYKQHLDDVYAFGNGLKMYLRAEAETTGAEFKNTVEWFEDSINLHILGRRQNEVALTRREFRARSIEGFKRFNWIKFIRSLKKFFGLATMGLKLVGGSVNFMFASLVTLKESLRNQIGNGPHTRFKFNDLREGFAEASSLVFKDAMTGKWSENKAYVLMDRFRFLPDNFDWYTSPNQLLTAKNKLFSTKSLYAFYTLPEEVIATSIFVAQLKAMKTPDGKSVWDHYVPVTRTDENGVPYTDYEWDGTVRGKVNKSNLVDKPLTEDLLGLTVEETNAIKFTYEKIHGGYRLDERTRAEYYILGEMMLQFKKYFPSILKNIGASRGDRMTQGFYEEVEENGEKVLRWTPQVIEGRWRMILGVLLHYLSVKASTIYKNGKPGNSWYDWLKLQSNEAYAWDQLSEVQKDDLRDSLLTLAAFVLMGVGGMMMWDRDEKDSLKRIYTRLQNDFAGNIYPGDVLYNAYNLRDPVVFAKSYKFLTSFTEVGWSALLDASGYDEQALTQEGYYRGWKELQGTIPILSANRDLVKFFSGTDEIEGPEWFEEKLK